jgi:hypothetical protein
MMITGVVITVAAMTAGVGIELSLSVEMWVGVERREWSDRGLDIGPG